jgi:hypothetical protein
VFFCVMYMVYLSLFGTHLPIFLSLAGPFALIVFPLTLQKFNSSFIIESDNEGENNNLIIYWWFVICNVSLVLIRMDFI